MIESICPTCECIYEAQDSEIGRTYVCRRCSTECIVPSRRIDVGSRYGDYEVLRPLGAGASSEVHLARDLRRGGHVALKVLFVDEADAETDTERFTRECRNAQILDHPSLTSIFHVGVQQGQHFLAMEYVEGDTVETILEDHGELDEDEALQIVRDVALGMQHAWEELELVHRDIKPANVIVSYEGRAKLMDLGIAKSVLDLKRLTDPDTVIGSPPYMSPEQCSPKNKPDCRSDIYSLGATFYHMVTNRYPFYGRTPEETVRMHLHSQLVDPRSFRSDISPEVNELIRRMMAKQPGSRPQTWDEVLTAVAQLIAHVG